MDEVWSVLVWLHEPPNDGELAEKVRQVRLGGEQSRSHRTRVFNPPALQRVHYGHYPSRDDAEAALIQLGEQLKQNEPIMIRGESHGYLIPAHSVNYLAMGKANHGEQEAAAD
jgi:hypothetical protein